ncbi:MAG: TonB-dependent receptor [Epsilonproteobacteria bacterium]|nr:TonB-dependent receptor [Campylobacterota bacterium]
MKKTITLSLIAVASLYAADVELSSVGVESTVITEVSQNAQTSADLSQALSSSVPSIEMNRRSGIANDIYIRGQKRDNISVEVDGTKVCGACPNRMDPPVSHILASQIDEVQVIEGPYDVETFGTMSGGVKIKTKQPKKDLSGSVDFGYGSWNYLKVGATVSGGNDTIRVLISGSRESSDQYKDGNGDTMAQQVKNYALANPTDAIAKGAQYQPTYEDMKAYTKSSLMTKAFINVTQDQELRLSYTLNRSDDVLYPNSKMDALYDDSNIYSIGYKIKNISDIYKNVDLQYYYSDVDHPMGTDYRKSSASGTVIVSQLKTTMSGLKLKNNFDVNEYKILIGLDSSKRTWDGYYYKNGELTLPAKKSIDNSVTRNTAIFTKINKEFGALNVSIGARYDSTTIDSDEAGYSSRDFDAFGANIFTSYNLNEENRIFIGFGQASRVPDARELFWRSSKNTQGGTPTLNKTTNQQVDFGYELKSDMFELKIKGFYSMLEDYIYYHKGLPKNNFENIDATIYGAELSASIYATDDITVDMGLSYKKGEKDHALAGQTDTDLADITPLRGNLALNYEYMKDSLATLEFQASDRWSDVDSDNGEQELAGWGVLNFKVKHSFNKNFNFTFGVNNLLDKTYTLSNTYADLTLITAGGDDVMLMNEPGRYVYTNLNFKF